MGESFDGIRRNIFTKLLFSLLLCWLTLRYLRRHASAGTTRDAATQTQTEGFWLVTANAMTQTRPTPTRTMNTQAQTTYARHRREPRFTPLGEAGHGACGRGQAFFLSQAMVPCR